MVPLCLLILVGAGLLGPGAAPAAAARLVARSGGAPFPRPADTRWAALYAAETGETVAHEGVGSGAGVEAIQGGAVAFGASDAARRGCAVPRRAGPVSQPGGRRQSRGATSRRQSLGGGLVSLPPQPSQDPLAVVIAKPEVSLGKRRCPHCDARVHRVKGFCPQCSEAYDFEPKLKAGDVVGGECEIKGAIAFGGMGWVYLGWDAVLSRWVVLKGLLNSRDPEAVAAALYRSVVATDPSTASACFGPARCEGRAARTELLALPIGLAPTVDEARLTRAAGMIEGIKADTAEMHLLTARLSAAALEPVADGIVPERRGATLLGGPMTATALRRGAEAAYLQAGRRAASRSEEARSVDLAHAIRPMTLL